MKILLWIVIGLVIVAVGLAGIGLALPSHFEVRRATEINAPAEKIYRYLEDPRQWARWTVWNERDPGMTVSYSGAPAGGGAKWSWESKTEGNGSMEFTRAEPNRRVEYTLFFPDFDMRSAGALTLNPAGGATRVTWTNAGEVGRNPATRYFALFMDRVIGPDFEKGLANLKRLAEAP
ncbi:MAG TPA: SRPBCC family protein [Usitatibacter sp.]|nr:SRPBCC family protein [Usitatibacter sp.]